MAGTVSIHYLGDPEQEKTIYALIKSYLDECPEDWTVSLLGNQQSTMWELKVKGAYTIEAGVKKVYGEDSGHHPQAILTDLRQIIESMRRITQLRGPELGEASNGE
jgi:hypothetical protein